MYKALISFCNEELDIAQGEILASDFASAEVIADLLAAGYIEEYTDPSGGAKIEVVTELPETGEANVIYLVPKQDTGDNDVFDEYLYVNDEWELIGTTDIDLSGYQPLLTAGNNITIDNNNVISASGGSSGDAKVYVYKITSGRGIHTTSSISATEANDLQRMGEIITNGYAHGLTGLYFGTTGYDFINFMSLSTNLSEKPTTIYFDGTIFARSNDGGAGSRYIEAYIEVKGTWSDDVFTCSQVKYTKYNTTSNGYVTTWRNTNAITPTSDYNPATKKYVDDKLTTYSGYDATKTQILKNINGTLTWVDE